MRYDDVELAVTDGLTIYARDYPGDGPALLCLHGLTRNSADFEAFVESLAPANRIIVPDQRGRGRSGWDPQPERYRPDTYTADMWALLDALGEEEVIVIGTSMGGLMGMLMAAEQPDRILGLVLNDIGPVVEPVGLARVQEYVGITHRYSGWDGAVAAVREQNADVFPDYDDAQWRTFTEGLCCEQDDGSVSPNYDPAIAQPINASKDAAVPPDLWPLFEAISVPMLLLRGERSDILHRGTAVEMQARQPAMAYVQVNNRGHAPMLDEPDAIGAIERFVSSRG